MPIIKMGRNFNVEESHNQDLIQIVEANGGAECRSWTQVARLYYARTGILVKRSYNLLQKWRSLTQYKEDLTPEQEQLMYEIGIQNSGSLKGGWSEFIELTGCKMKQGRFRQKVGQFMVLAIRGITDAYMHRKYTIRRQSCYEYQKIPYTATCAMLRACYYSGIATSDPQFEILQISAMKLQKLLFLYIKHGEDDKATRYHHFMQNANRKEFKRILFFLEYIGELVKISQGIYDDNCIRKHPLVNPILEENKRTLFYKELIQENDWSSKFELYKSCSDNQIDQFSVLIKPTAKKKDNNKPQQMEEEKLQNYDMTSHGVHKVCQKAQKASKAQIKEVECQKMRTFRGHFVRKGQMRTTGVTTIIFDHDVDSEDIENEDFDYEQKAHQEKIMQEKIQELYKCTFGKEEEEMQRKKKKKKKPYETF